MHIVRTKAWPKVFYWCIYLLCVQLRVTHNNTQDASDMESRDVRWQLVRGLVDFARQLDTNGDSNGLTGRLPVPTAAVVSCNRWDPGSALQHHRVSMSSYVTPEEREEQLQLQIDNPCTGKPIGGGNPRRRDRLRQDGKVRSAISFAANCVVCWASGTNKRTLFYCRECQLDPNWTYKPRANGWALAYHPRLCSDECFVKFHQEQVHGLDHHKRKFTRDRGHCNNTRVPRPRGNNARDPNGRHGPVYQV